MKVLAVHPGPLMALRPSMPEHTNSRVQYALPLKGRRGRALDDSAEQFVEATRTGNSL